MTNNDILRKSPLYLLDIEDTLFDKSSKTLKLDSYHNYLKSLDDIPGINTSFIYVGGRHSMFALHIEDYILFSIRDFLHAGSPKMNNVNLSITL